MAINGWLLRKACRAGVAAQVKSLLQDENMREHLNDACARGHTPLHRAASRGSVEIAVMLLDAGAAVNPVCRFGYTPLHEAACRGYVDIARLLLERGADPNISAYSKGGATSRNGWTPLFVASRHGHAPVVRELLQRGADIDQCDDGWTCLHSAASGGFDSVISLLLMHRPNLTIITRGTFWFETAEEVARLSSTRTLLQQYRRSLLSKTVFLALAFESYQSKNLLKCGYTSDSTFLSLPLDVILLILAPLAEKDFAKTSSDLAIFFRWVVANATEWRTRVAQQRPLTVKCCRKNGSPKLEFTTVAATDGVQAAQGDQLAMHG